jgi:hypothetical protein
MSCVRLVITTLVLLIAAAANAEPLPAAPSPVQSAESSEHIRPRQQDHLRGNARHRRARRAGLVQRLRR